MINTNWAILSISVIVLLFIAKKIYLPNSSYTSGEEYSSAKLNEWTSEYYNIATKYGTDKVNGHRYDFIYGAYLGPLRNVQIDLLEIGLGCTMRYGPGKSLLTWREFLPKARITILEYDGECAEKFRSQVENLFIGDQSNFDLLAKIGQSGPYDVIIDDGGHTNKQQVNTLIGLWPYVKSGGIFVAEDIHMWHQEHYNDSPRTLYDSIVMLQYLIVHKIVGKTNNPKNIVLPDDLKPILKSLKSINCFNHACVLNKK